MRVPLLCASILFAAVRALASGGLSCEAKDEHVALAIDSGVTRGMGNPVFNFRGTLEIADLAVAEDLASTAFEGGHLAQYWSDGDSLKLRLYRERDGDAAHGYVELVIETAPGGDDGSFEGQYRLTVFDMTGDVSGEGRTVSLDGNVRCFVE